MTFPHDAVIVFDSRLNVVAWNEAATLLLGYDMSDALGRPLHDFVPQRLHAIHDRNVSDFASSPVSGLFMSQRTPVKGVHKDGHEVELEASIAKSPTAGADLYTAVLRKAVTQPKTVGATPRQLIEQRVEAALVSPGSVEGRLIHAIEVIADTTGLEHATLFFVDNDSLVRVAHALPEWQPTPQLERPINGDGVAPRAYRLQEPQVARYSGKGEPVGPFAGRPELRAVVAIPVSSDRKRIGVLVMGSAKVRTIGQRKINLLTYLCAGLAVHVERLGLINQEPARYRTTEALLKIGRATSNGAGYADKAPEILEAVSELVAANTSIYVAEQDGSLRSLGLSDHAQGEHRIPSVSHITAGEGAVGQCFATGRPVLIRDYPKTSAAKRNLVKEGMTSLATVPIHGTASTLGVLVVGSNRPAHFGVDLVDVLEVVALQIGAVMEAELLQQEVKDMEAQAVAQAALQQQQAEFTSTISHELRTPLTSLQGSLSLLDGGQVDAATAQGRNLLSIASRSTQRLTDLVNQFLEIERIASGSAPLDRARTKSAAMLTIAVEEMNQQAAAKEITLKVAGSSIQMDVDQARIIQVITNLLSNAIKFSPPGSTVEAGVQPHNASEALLWVTDEGRGIAAKDHERIFDRFVQVDGSDSREHPGSGLGLPICKAIIEQHGGTIRVESTLGKGAKFSCTLPLTRN